MQESITINANDLITLLQPLEAIVNPSHIVPIFRCVHIVLDGKKMYATGDNAEVRCQNSMKLRSDVDSNICVDFSMLSIALKSVQKSEVELSIKKTMLLIKHENGDFNIPLEDASAYPESKSEELTNKAKIKSDDLKNALGTGTRFLLDSELEPVSNLSIDISKKKTIVRGTNKVSLYRHKIKSGGDDARLLISGKAASAVKSLLDGDSGDITVRYSESVIVLGFGNREVKVVLQKGNFPIDAFDGIMSTVKDSSALIVDHKELVTSLKRVSSLSRREKQPVIRFDVTEENLNLKCENDSSSSSVQENLKVEFSATKTIGFNSKFILEVLSVFGEGAEFSINEKNCFCIRTKNTSALLAPIMLSK